MMTGSPFGRAGQGLLVLAAGVALAVPIAAWVDWADVPVFADGRGATPAPGSDPDLGAGAGRGDGGVDPAVTRAQKAEANAVRRGQAGANADRRGQAGAEPDATPAAERGARDGGDPAATPRRQRTPAPR